MGKLNQALTGIAASFSALIMGSLNVWPSYTLKLYTAENTTLLTKPMTEFEASLVGSLPSLGAMVGTAITGLLINAYGRKRGVMLLTLPYVFHWVIIECSSTSVPIIIARFIGGIGGGAYCVYAPIYVSEIAEPSIRGALASGTLTFYSIGTLVSYLNGWFLSYGTIVWLNLGLCVLNLLMLSIAVESPVFLLRQKREQEALKALAHYRKGSTTSKDVLEELSLMKQLLLPALELVALQSVAVKKQEDAEKEKLNIDNEVVFEVPKTSAIKQLLGPNRKAFTVVGTTLFFQVLMGMATVQVYAGELFSRAAPDLSSDLCSVLLALVLFAGCAVVITVVDKAGRRMLLISSSALVALCMGTLGLLLQTNVAPAWVSAVVILVFCFCFCYGACAVPYVMLAEYFTSEVIGIASLLLIEMVWLVNFLLIAVFPFMVSLVGIHGTFYMFASVAAANTVFSYFKVPETKGLSNQEIQDLFRR